MPLLEWRLPGGSDETYKPSSFGDTKLEGLQVVRFLATSEITAQSTYQ
jgi:hypothetical protein